MDMEHIIFLALMFLMSTFVNVTFAGFLSLKMGEFIWRKIQKL